jgi:hypothetical protein
MPIFQQDLTLDPGGDYLSTTCAYVVNGVIQDFTGCSARLYIYKNAYDMTPFLSLTSSVTANGYTYVNGLFGTVTFNIRAVASLALNPYIGPLYYNLYLDRPNPVIQINVTNGGSSYTSAPTISFTGGGGSNAAATASLSNGAVNAITVTDMGYGYTSAPTVVFSSGAAAATALVESIYTLQLQAGNVFLNNALVTE